MTRNGLLGLVFFLAIGIVPARAFCILNETSVSIDFFAEQCSDCLRATLAPSEALCCPAGEKHCRDRVITFKNAIETDALAWSDCGAPVPASGWVRLHGKENEKEAGHIMCRVMDAGGKLLSDKIVAPSRTCPAQSLTPSTC